MSEAPLRDAYTGLAEVYNALLGDLEEWSDRWYDRLGEYLDGVPPEARILDCACGTGAQAYALARNGHTVTATDASGAMLAEARSLFDEKGLQVPTAECRWTELAGHVDGPFDIVLCLGNSISHCRSAAAMSDALSSMRRVLRKGGRLLVDSRSWERLMAERPRFTVSRPRRFRGVRTLPVYVWTFGEWGRKSSAEILLVFEREPEPTCVSHTIDMYPFRRRELADRLERCGFDRIEAYPFEGGNRYCMVCRGA